MESFDEQPVRSMDTPMLDFEEITLPEESQETTFFFAVRVPLHSDHNLAGKEDPGDESLARRTIPKATPNNPESTAYIVGTILKLGSSSANIWFGWGEASSDGVVLGAPRTSHENNNNNSKCPYNFMLALLFHVILT
jgi:hypothetical protein